MLAVESISFPGFIFIVCATLVALIMWDRWDRRRMTGSTRETIAWWYFLALRYSNGLERFVKEDPIRDWIKDGTVGDLNESDVLTAPSLHQFILDRASYISPLELQFLLRAAELHQSCARKHSRIEEETFRIALKSDPAIDFDVADRLALGGLFQSLTFIAGQLAGHLELLPEHVHWLSTDTTLEPRAETP